MAYDSEGYDVDAAGLRLQTSDVLRARRIGVKKIWLDPRNAILPPCGPNERIETDKNHNTWLILLDEAK